MSEQDPQSGKAVSLRGGTTARKPLPVAPGEPPRRDRLYELVLPAWHDKPGSKLRWYDFARALIDVGYIWRERVAHRSRDETAAPASRTH